MSDRVWVSTRKGLFGLSRSGGGYRVDASHFVGDRVSLTMVDPRDGSIYAALDHGHFGVKMQVSRDGGSTFSEMPAPAYPAKPDGLEDVQKDGKPLPWAVKLVWSMAPGGADQEGVLWLGTIPGGLFKSDDRGETWSLVESLWNEPRRKEWFGGGADQPGIHSLCVDPRDSDRVIAGVSCGGVWETTDGGDSWEVRADGMFAEFMPPEHRNNPVIQDPHSLAMCTDHPDVIWSQHHNGIFVTRDGAQKWQVIEKAGPSTFGFACKVHPSDPDTAWFIPAVNDQHRLPVDGKLVVTRTRDGGKSFDVLTDGLPQDHAYDLIYRHALALDDAGQQLVFGSTTGSLFASDDQGDSWQRVTAHLPPIYAVTYG